MWWEERVYNNEGLRSSRFCETNVGYALYISMSRRRCSRVLLRHLLRCGWEHQGGRIVARRRLASRALGSAC